MLVYPDRHASRSHRLALRRRHGRSHRAQSGGFGHEPHFLWTASSRNHCLHRHHWATKKETAS